MSGSFFSDLNLPMPDIHLGAGSGSHAVQTAEIMKKFEEVLLGKKPDVVVVVGDVNSTLACALVYLKSVIPLPRGRSLVWNHRGHKQILEVTKAQASVEFTSPTTTTTSVSSPTTLLRTSS